MSARQPANKTKCLRPLRNTIKLKLMSESLKELVSICESLPKELADELVDFARFLKQKSAPRRKKTSLHKESGDKKWQRILCSERRRPKLDAMIAKVERDISEGKTQPLDLNKL